MVTESSGVIRVARQVLLTIIVNVALETPGVIRMAQGSDQWARFLGREVPRQGVALTIKENTISADLYIEVASAIEEMVGMQVREVNVYIQDVA